MRYTIHMRRSFAPLSIPNYRRFFIGQVFARCGAWVQTVAEIWLVLSLTGSGVSLGLTTALHASGDERYAWLNDVVCVGAGEVLAEAGLTLVLDVAELVREFTARFPIIVIAGVARRASA
jgi:hypothetical protein